MTQDAKEIDLDRLDAFLSSDDSPDDSLMLSDLDGFLHGIACSPVMISSHEWMPKVLGGAADTVPEWVLEDIASLYMNICDGLTSEHPQIEPDLLAGQGRPCHCDGLVRGLHDGRETEARLMADLHGHQGRGGAHESDSCAHAG